MNDNLDKVRQQFSKLTTLEYNGHRKKVHSVAWDASGGRLASGSIDQTVRVWTIEESGKSKDIELKGHTNSVDQVEWHPSSEKLLASASADLSVRIWDAKSGTCVKQVGTPGENINISWSPDGHEIAVGDKKDLISIIDTRTFNIVKSTKFRFEVNEITWDPTGTLFLLTSGLGQVEILNYPSFENVKTIHAHTGSTYCINYSRDGSILAVGSADATVSIWDAEDLICLRTFGRLDWPVRCVSFSHDNQFIASASEDLVIDISHVESGEGIYQLPVRAAMNSVSWHPKRLLIAHAGDEISRKTQTEGGVKIFGFPPSTS